MSLPKVSIITVCLNAAAHMEAAIRSVEAQSYPGTEYIVIDGGSTDGTLDIIGRHRASIDYFVSEPDRGLYDAMNKGLKASTGDIIFFLNADDYLVDEKVVEDVAALFARDSGVDIVFGNLIFTDGTTFRAKKQGFKDIRRRLAGNHVQHQTLFARKRVFDAVGGFSEEYRIVSDYDWELKAFLVHGCRWAYIDRDISVMSTRGISATTDFEPERRKVMKKYFSPWEIFWHRALPLGKARLMRTLTR